MSTYPPDGVEVGSGTWGVDVDFVVDEDSQSGDGYLQFANTTPAADPWVYTEWIPTSAGSPILVEGVVAADSNAAGNTVFIKVEWGDFEYDSMGSSTVFDGLVTTVNTWERKSAVLTAPATARFFRAWFGKNNTAFNAWFDAVDADDFPKSFSAKPTSDQTVSVDEPAYVALGTETFDHGGVFGSSAFTAPVTGIYLLSYRAFLTSTTPGFDYSVWIERNYDSGGLDFDTKTAGDTDAVKIGGSFHVLLTAGDVVRMIVSCLDGGGYVVEADYSFFSGSSL